MKKAHIPVLQKIVKKYINPTNGVFFDGTFGAGGHSRLILETNTESTLWASDRDKKNTDIFAINLKYDFSNRFNFILSTFCNLQKNMQEIDNTILFDALIFDLGVSSMQIDSSDFSFFSTEKLNMNMGMSEKNANEIVNNYSFEKLRDILKEYGEENMATAITKAIIRNRPVETNEQLSNVVKYVKRNKKSKIHPATKVFQAIRIEVNNELNELNCALNFALKRCKIGGNILFISFHSLEDRIVKKFFNKHANNKPSQNRYVPPYDTTKNISLEIINKTPIIADKDEIRYNPRARSAKLRIAKKIMAVNL